MANRSTSRGTSRGTPQRRGSGAPRPGGGGSRGRPPARRPATPPAPRPALPVLPEHVPGVSAARARAVALAPVAVAVLGVALLAAGVVFGVALLVLGLAAVLAGAVAGSPARVARRLGGRPADPERDARLVNVADALCVGLGVAAPELRLLDDPAPNALVLGTGRSTVLFCTSGLVDQLDRLELEGLVAHELAHVKRGDAARAALAMRALAPFALLGDAPARWMGTLAGPESESYADQRAVLATRYPPGLAAALEKLAAAPATRPAGIDRVAARLTAARWCATLDEARHAAPRPGVLALAERAAALREL